MNDTFPRPLPNGPHIQEPKRIIVHAMGEYIIYVDDHHRQQILHAVDYLDMRGLSAHCLVTPSGVRIRCWRDDQGAWHAKGHNINSLGIEYLVPGVHNYASFEQKIQFDYVSPAQWAAGLDEVRRWKRLYHITQIERHSDVDPDRKIDPGDGFPWQKFLEAL